MRFLFVDRILDSQPGEHISGLKHVTRDDYYLCPDEEGRLCFIPSLMGETLGQLAAWNVMQHVNFTHRPVAGVVASARLFRPAYVGETLYLESFIDNLDATVVQYHSVARVNDESVFTLTGALGPLLPMETFIEPVLARQQFAEIYRPGEWVPVRATAEVINLETQTACYAPLMTFDRVVECQPGVQLRAEKSISRAAAFFPDHFPAKPVLPMTVLLECKLNLAQEFIRRAGWGRYRVQELRKIKMNDFIYPGDILTTTITLRSHSESEVVMGFRTTVADRRVCVLELVMTGIT